MAASDELNYLLFVKAVAGGGGRGMRRVDDPAGLREAIDASMREADRAFGDPTCFIEEAVVNARHIEVQILADTAGNVTHLYDRDCSVQRRHQKAAELAPAPNLDPEVRDRMSADAVKFARAIGYTCAGTVEFLLNDQGHYVFIEMNPRIQVEHTVTEEVTDVDLVQAQMRIASGATLPDIGLVQDSIVLRGAALQCRITTENPANGFRPDTGRISTYRSPGGPGVRLDGGTTYTGAGINAHSDSLLTKLTCRGHDFGATVQRASRALSEFRVGGVATNIDFLRGLLADEDFREARLTTTFIDEHPELMAASVTADVDARLLTYLAEITVNRLNGPAPTDLDPRSKLSKIDLDASAPHSSRQLLHEVGPRAFAAALRS